MRTHARASQVVLLFAVLLAFLAPGALLPQQDATDDRFVVSEVMIPMRDGVRLHTRIFAPKDQQGSAPVHHVADTVWRKSATKMLITYLKALVNEGYIFVFQDIRGKFGSEGTFVMQRPARTPGDAAVLMKEPTPTTRSSGCLRTCRKTMDELGFLVCHISVGPPSWGPSNRIRRSRRFRLRLRRRTCGSATTFITTARFG